MNYKDVMLGITFIGLWGVVFPYLVSAESTVAVIIGIIGATTSIINPEPSGVFASKTQLGPSEPKELMVPEIEPTVVEFPQIADHKMDRNFNSYTGGRIRINYLKSMQVAKL